MGEFPRRSEPSALEQATCLTVHRGGNASYYPAPPHEYRADHKVRGKYLTVDSPIKLSNMKVEIAGLPLLGEHTDEVLAELGYTPNRIATRKPPKPAVSCFRHLELALRN